MIHSRYLYPFILNDALSAHKMAFLSGPRQVGKTHLAKCCLKNSSNYFNWDDVDFKKSWVKSPSATLENMAAGPVVFDEIHKYKKWKTTLKGLYDRIGKEVPMIVTGSAKLDLYKRGGDSLLGRYLPYRLNPFTVAERNKNFPVPNEWQSHPCNFSIGDLLNLSGFPEPLLGGSQKKAKRWSRLRLEQIIRGDVRDFKNIYDLELISLLAHLLPERVGSPLSMNGLVEDVGVTYATLREWLAVLESVYVCFKVKPYHRNISRALKKEAKYYLYDWTEITSAGARLENLVAVHLLKICQFWTDTAEGVFDLYYLRTKEKAEVDFLITSDQKPWLLVECKSNETSISPALKKFADFFKNVTAFQLTTANVDKKIPGSNIHLINTEKFLTMLI